MGDFIGNELALKLKRRFRHENEDTKSMRHEREGRHEDKRLKL